VARHRATISSGPSFQLAIKSVSCPQSISYMSYRAWVTDND
jgi:hypothetical protein